ncbi:MAG: DNA alkylation repair protein [Planctomycetia bacterium]|nr:DNA alkylation repair protein [Planctomycetia bacterium]
MTVDEVMRELERLGNPTTKRTLMKHGAREPCFGVKIEELKKLHKRFKGDHALALALFETGNADAMYLAGIAADPAQMKKSDLKRWAKGAHWSMLSDYAVAGVAAESPHARELGWEWIDSKLELIAGAGWATLTGWVSITPDDELPLGELKKLLDRVAREIHTAKNRTRYSMNGFVIGVAAYVEPLMAHAYKVAKKIGAVEVDMGDTSCKVPLATEYIDKIRTMGRIGRKRKSARC